MEKSIKNTLIITITNILSKLLNMLFFVLLARSLTIPDYGIFRYLITLSMMLGIVFTGIPTAMTKFISEDKSRLKETASNSLFLMLLSFLIIAFLASFYEYRAYLALFLFAILVDSFYLGFIRGLLNYTKLAGFKLTENIIQLAILAASFVIYKEVNFFFAVVFYSFSGIISLFIFEKLKPELKLHRELSKGTIKKIIRFTIPVTLGSIGWELMFGINAVFIKMFHSTEQLAYYSVATTMVQVFTFLPAAIATILMPKASSLKDKSKLKKPIRLAIAATILTSAFGLALLVILIKPIITLIFQERYLPAAAIILPLSLGQIFISLHQIYASAFQGLNKPNVPSTTISIAAVLNIIGSYFLTKNYGILGASISNAITSFIALIIISAWFKKQALRPG